MYQKILLSLYLLSFRGGDPQKVPVEQSEPARRFSGLARFEADRSEVDFTDVSTVDFKRPEACLGASGYILNPESQILPPSQ